MRSESLEFLKQLLATPSPSGYEAANQKIWCDYARQFADEVRTDAYGNALAILNPGGNPKVMFDGHMDELGLMVRYIDDKGFIYVQQIGGVDPAVARGKSVNIHTAKGVVRGVTGSTAIHLQERNKEHKTPKLHEVFIDIGAKDGKDAARKVSVGDPVTFAGEFGMLNEHVAFARAFDNRVGAWAGLEAMRMAKAGKLACSIYACSSVQEEVGLAGAVMNVFHVQPDVAVIVDVTHSTDTPGIDVKQHGEIKLGEGPTISIGRENHPMLAERMKKAAHKAKIRVQMETFSTSGGTDALAIYTKHGGTPSLLIGIPTRYMHTTVEIIDLRDLQKTADLLAAFVLDIKRGERFVVKV